MKEAMAVLGTVVGIIIVFTLLSGGRLTLGTNPAGPVFQFGFQGPQYRGG
jgi:hypothetical protein